MKQFNKVEQLIANSSKDVYENQLVDFIKQVVCTYYKVDIEQLLTTTRLRLVVKARQVVMYLLCVNSKIPKVNIAKRFNKDHSTVIHSKKTIEGYLEWDKELSKEVNELQNLIIMKAKSYVNSLNVEEDFYFIDLNNFHSLRCNERKAIILVGYSEEEVNEFSITQNLKKVFKKHKNKGLYILEKLNYI